MTASGGFNQEEEAIKLTYGKYFRNPDLSDITLCAKDGCTNRTVEFPAHTFIISDRSRVFREMVETRRSEWMFGDGSQFKLFVGGIDAQTLSLILEHIYKGVITLPASQGELFRLMEAAEKYELEGLRSRWTSLPSIATKTARNSSHPEMEKTRECKSVEIAPARLTPPIVMDLGKEPDECRNFKLFANLTTTVLPISEL